MKIRVQLKDPDCLDDAVLDAVRVDVQSIDGLKAGERKALAESRADGIRDECKRRWFEWGEYLQVEIDTDAWTIRVVPRSEE